jgi:pimeloyl-ACP methyl ester carboxylesterase
MPDVEVPDWFVTAIADEPEHCNVDVDGARIHYRRWASPDQPGLVLVHGGAAHSGWWDHVAPLLAGEYCVVALDLSGHGDSDRRSGYDLDTWAREVVAVADDTGMGEPPMVIAHSMGGWVGMTAAADHGEHLGGLILLDSMVRRPDPEEEAHRVGAAFGPLRVYPTLEDALAHFRTVPDQPTSLPYVIDHVARGSLREVEGGWSWKFDPRIFERRSIPPGDLLHRIRCRVALFRSEHGLVSRDIREYMYEQLGRVAPMVEVPLAWHHVMLDQPIPLVTGLRALLADWEHSTPRRRAD